MSRLPIRVRLTLVFALVMAVVFAAVGAFLYVRLGDTLDERIADTLEARTTALASSLDATSPGVAGEEGVAQVLDADGSVVSGNEAPLLTSAQLEQARRASLMLDAEISGADFRLLAAPLADRVVVVGESLEDRDEALDALLAQLLVVLPLALVASSALGYVTAGAALRPMEEMRREAAEISSSSSGRRLPLSAADDEVRRLGTTLNEMLERLDAGLERERQFVADASHELRTPLAILKAELELALRKPRSARELEDALSSALEETERLAQLAEDLLVVARSERGVLRIEPEPVRVDELLEEVAQRFRGAAGGRLIDIDGDAPEIYGDGARLERAVGNLIDNAIQHGAGAVRVRSAVHEEMLELRVTDEGAGFDPAFIPAAFERFSRADRARTSSGAGLGLAIVRAIAVAHGGSAGARNGEGGGADVWLVVPSRLNSEHAPRRDRSDVG